MNDFIVSQQLSGCLREPPTGKSRERATPHTHCRACSTELPPAFLDFGMQPLANNLCTEEQHSDERYPMRLARCGKCGLLQLDTVIDPAVLFSHYLYTPSQSKKTLAHFESLAEAATKRFPWVRDPDAPERRRLALDIGSNDGALMGFLAKREWCVVGVDPAANLAAEANAKGLPTICDFFSDEAVARVRSAYGMADLVTACNVFAHTPDWRAFAERAARILAPKGLIAIEFPYGPTMLKDGLLDLVYFEHASFPSLGAVAALLKETTNLRVVDVETLPAIHGGSVRVWIGRGGEHEVAGAVSALLADEEKTCSLDACAEFVEEVEDTRLTFAAAVKRAREKGDVIGYTAPAKAVTLIEFSGLGKDDISCIVDDNPLKQGRMLPGSHVPIVGLKDRVPKSGDTVIIFAWNVAEDIVARLPKGARAIVPMPKVTLIER